MNQNSKKASVTQNYENYWKLTVETTNIHGSQFIDTLRILIQLLIKFYRKESIKFSKRKITVQQEKV